MRELVPTTLIQNKLLKLKKLLGAKVGLLSQYAKEIQLKDLHGFPQNDLEARKEVWIQHLNNFNE